MLRTISVILILAVAGCSGPTSPPKPADPNPIAARHFEQSFMVNADVDDGLQAEAFSDNCVLFVMTDRAGAYEVLNGSATMTWNPIMPGQDLVLRLRYNGTNLESGPGQSPLHIEFGPLNVTFQDFIAIIAQKPPGSVHPHQPVNLTIRFDWVGDDVDARYSNCQFD